MWEWFVECMGEGWSGGNRLILSFGRREWIYVLFVVMAWGCFCMRGFGRRL